MTCVFTKDNSLAAVGAAGLKVTDRKDAEGAAPVYKVCEDIEDKIASATKEV
jgi:hypothetical protein